MVQSIDSMRSGRSLGRNAGSSWLKGSYLAGASQFPETEDYWLGYGEYLTAARTAHEGFFARSLTLALDGTDRAPAEHDAIEAEASKWFQDSKRLRDEAWARLEVLVSASLGLHTFLEEHEAEIDHEPVASSGISRDPVLEAVPQTEEISDGMWEFIEDITDQLLLIPGIQDGVTTEALTQALLTALGTTTDTAGVFAQNGD
jgi:hypothetical protein